MKHMKNTELFKDKPLLAIYNFSFTDWLAPLNLSKHFAFRLGEHRKSHRHLDQSQHFWLDGLFHVRKSPETRRSSDHKLLLKCTFCYPGNHRCRQINLDWNLKLSSIKQTFSWVLWKENPPFTLIISKSHSFFQETSVETVTKSLMCKNKVADQTKINGNKMSTYAL